MKKRASLKFLISCCAVIMTLTLAMSAWAISDAYKDNIYNPGKLKPIDSKLKVKVGQKTPDFTLPAVAGGKVALSQYLGKKNIVLSFVPAAWTPVCSDQWPGYNIVRDMFEANDAVLLGITVDNIPTLFSWTNQMGKLWFPVLSDFYPHGKVAQQYGILRTDGVTERAIFVIDKKGIIRYIDVHDINERPSLEGIITALENLKQ
jgi:peroxiredoxin (alkyl hydroperoxide reductase subunit C)